MHQGFRKELWTKLVEVLIIDEISMLSGEWLDNLERMLRELTHYYGRGEFQQYLRMPMKDIPAFGGIQVVVVGDFYQLPPIPATIHGETFQRLDHGLFHAQHIPKDSHTKKIYFTNRGYAFQSMAWRAAEFVYVRASARTRRRSNENCTRSSRSYASTVWSTAGTTSISRARRSKRPARYYRG
jgi:ATP-dependent DNA helicase PIF1